MEDAIIITEDELPPSIRGRWVASTVLMNGKLVEINGYCEAIDDIIAQALVQTEVQTRQDVLAVLRRLASQKEAYERRRAREDDEGDPLTIQYEKASASLRSLGSVGTHIIGHTIRVVALSVALFAARHEEQQGRDLNAAFALPVILGSTELVLWGVRGVRRKYTFSELKELNEMDRGSCVDLLRSNYAQDPGIRKQILTFARALEIDRMEIETAQ